MNPAVVELLEENYLLYDRPSFIEKDPISIPHRFSKKQDIEIAAFFAAMLAWGQRTTIINNCNRLMDLMDNAPHAFVLQHTDKDLQRFESFVHRTFNATDLLYCIAFFRWYYLEHTSLEDAFAIALHSTDAHAGPAISGFHQLFFSLPDAPQRTRKHIATPERGSTCKRMNMYLRWMVRKDVHGVDFGIWDKISPSQLLCPLDVHVERVARKLGLLTRKQRDWMAVLELTDKLREIDPIDPVRFDFALFGMGIHDDLP